VEELTVIVDCAHYRDGRRQHEGRMELGRAAEICLQDECFVWLGLFEPDPAEMEEVQARFGLHDLAVEDAQNYHLRPKMEQYDNGDVLFAVFRTRPATSMTVRTSRSEKCRSSSPAGS
jgi:magnesium transporter